MLLDPSGKPISPHGEAKRWPRLRSAKRTLIMLAAAAASLTALTANLDSLFGWGRRLVGADTREGISVSLAAADDSIRSIEEQIRRHSPPRDRDGFKPTNLSIRHTLSDSSGVFIVRPVSVVLDDYFQRNEAPALWTMRDYFRLGFPTVDVIVTNNASRTLVLTKLELVVAASQPDYRPLFMVVPDFRDGLRSLRLENEGWGIATEFRYRLDFAGPGLGADSVIHIEGRLGDVARGAVIDLRQALAGEPDERLATVTGEISYRESQSLSTPARRLKFGPMPLERFHRVGGGPMPISDEFELLLASDSSAYRVVQPLAHEVSKGSAERIRLRLAAPMSSHHRFHIVTHFSDQSTQRSPVVHMHLVFPRSNLLALLDDSGVYPKRPSLEAFVDDDGIVAVPTSAVTVRIGKSVAQ